MQKLSMEETEIKRTLKEICDIMGKNQVRKEEATT